jgi:Kef-type K+ transport system membrane component KefB
VFPLPLPAEATGTLIAIFIAFAAAKLGGELAARLGTATLLGEIAAGAVLGPHGLGWLHDDPILMALADLGVITLLFSVGLETDFDRLRAVGSRGVLVGAAGVVLPFLLGSLLMLALGYTTVTALFVGTALVATSVGITARVLAELKVLDRAESLIILAAAVTDDVIGLLVLAIVTSLSIGLDVGALVVLFAETAFFIVTLLTIGRRGVRRHGHRVAHLRTTDGPLSVALVALLALSALAGQIGLAAIVGAFLSGLVIAELSDEFELRRDFRAIQTLLVPFFFVLTGARFDLTGLGDPQILGLTIALTIIAILTKILGCGLAMAGTNLGSAVIVGLGMVPRGEVGLVVASIGLIAGVIDSRIYAAVILMVAVTTLIAPVFLGPVFRRFGRVPGGSPLAARQPRLQPPG